MIGKLTGTVTQTHQNPLILDVHDVGYLVHVTDKFASELTPQQPLTLYIHTHIREDAFDLYGFPTQQELALFQLLLTVSGIGPKTALTVVGRGATAVERAVKQSDVDFFTTVPRLGKKNAQKIIIELKNKLGGLIELNLKEDTDGETKQIKEALIAMGFGKHEVSEVLVKLDEGGETLEAKIRLALKLLGKRT
jgi:holliday junction DNA helicase RuvA